jgi:ABC-type multidrug transport system ATPase subunit
MHISVRSFSQPTSGLDAYNALAICRFLKSYAQRKQRTIVMSIHQPRADILRTFDQLMVLGGGRMVRERKRERERDDSFSLHVCG